MEDKYCPVVSIAKKEYTNCIKDKCALWEESLKGCSVTVLVSAALFAAGELMMKDNEEG